MKNIWHKGKHTHIFSRKVFQISITHNKSIFNMENNISLLGLDSLDINVLFMNMSDNNAFDIVAELLNKSRYVTNNLNDYYDYLWEEYANNEPWEREIKKHRPHHDNINILKQRLLLLIVNNINRCQTIASQLKSGISIDIKSLIFEMPSYKALPLLERLYELICTQVDEIEMFSIHGENYSEEKHRDMNALIELREKVRAIINEQVKLEMERDAEIKAAQLEESKFICETLEIGKQIEEGAESKSNANITTKTEAA